MVPDETPPSGSGGGANSGPTGGAAAAGGAGTDGSSPFRSHVSRVVDRIGELAPFALVPLVMTLLEVENVRAALDPAPGRYSLGIKFVLPSPVLDLWSLADPPESRATGRGGPPPIGSSSGHPLEGLDAVDPLGVPAWAVGVGTTWIAAALLAIAVYVLVSAGLTAIYVGGLDRRLRGEPVAVGELLSRYFPPFVLYQLVLLAALLALLPLLFLSPAIFLLAMPVALVLWYLFYAAPFLFVVDDAPVLEAFRRSYGFAVEGGAYLAFAAWHLGVMLVVSLVASALVNAGAPGFLLALAIAVPLSFVLTGATVSFLQDLTGERARAAGSRRRPRP